MNYILVAVSKLIKIIFKSLGIQIFTSYIPNISRAFHSTIFEDRLHRRSHSVSAFCGFLNTLAFVSSLYHLLLLGMQRIYAVKCPLKFRHRNMKPVYAWISVVWLIAILIALAPSKYTVNNLLICTDCYSLF